MTKITFRLPRSIRLSLQRSQGNANDLRLQDISTVAIENVEKLDPCEMVCIKTTNPSSLYVTDDFVVTHNTSLLT
ncbi:hypothetical protein, partial [Stenotrophomonas maltophilia]|uniref:hypothetical protein n=1 Tax=Stenotrophomonas maltophilia TaxID=40324 RepID=UPI001952D1BC